MWNTKNVSACKIQQLDTSGAGAVFGMNDCNQASSIEMVDLDGAAAVYGVYRCNQLSSLHIEDLDSSGGEVQGIYDSDQIASSYIYDLLAPANSDIYGMNTVNNVSACKIQQLDTSGTGDAYGTSVCNQLSSMEIIDIDAAAIAYGIYGDATNGRCISSVLIDDIESSGSVAVGISNVDCVSSTKISKVDGVGNVYGITGCQRISSLWVGGGGITSSGADAIGMYGCDQLAASTSDGITASGTASGFNTCTYGAAIFTSEAVNGSCDWIDTVDAQITNKVSTPSIWT